MTPAEDYRLDPALVAALYLNHADELRSFLLGVLRNADLAAEAMQIAFSKAVEVGHTAHEETLKGWLFRVAFHEALALRRRETVHGKALQTLTSQSVPAQEFPADKLIRWETVEIVRQALELLPAEQKQIVRLRIYEERTFAAIAAELQLPLGTVLTRMQLALKKLRNKLSSHE